MERAAIRLPFSFMHVKVSFVLLRDAENLRTMNSLNAISNGQDRRMEVVRKFAPECRVGD